MPTVYELRNEAMSKNIKGTSKLSKKELCELLGYDEDCYKTAKQKKEEKRQTYLVSELREIAKERGIKGYSKMTKAKLCETLNIPNCTKPADTPKPAPKAKAASPPKAKAASPPKAKAKAKAKAKPKTSGGFPGDPGYTGYNYSYSYSGYGGGGYSGYGGGGYGGSSGGGYGGSSGGTSNPKLDKAFQQLKAFNIKTHKEFKQWALKNHPDKFQDAVLKSQAEAIFKGVSGAIAVISSYKDQGIKSVDTFYGM